MRAELGGRLPHSVVVVVGTRPEAIKLAPVAEALAERSISPMLVFTGQHPTLNPGDYRLGGYRAVRLDCPGQHDPHAHVAMVTEAVHRLLAPLGAAIVVVQGDTSSALGGARAAGLAAIPVAHVEAGLRSHDGRHPWPEEEFRIAIDRDSELLFAPTELSAANLRRERVRGRIHVTGNTGIDALFAVPREIPRPAARKRPKLLVTCHRRENWDSAIDEVAEALARLASEGAADIDIVLHPNPALSRRLRDRLRNRPRIRFREPCGHSETISAIAGADLVLSDSGGIQEEAAALGAPLLVLRTRTERPEAIASGNMELVGTDCGRIVAAVRRRLGGARSAPPSLPFGDGRAAERIAAIIELWLAEKVLPSPKSSAVPRTARFW